MLELLKRKDKVVGIKQTKKAVEEEKLEAVFIACDADQRVVGQLKLTCEEKQIPVCETESMKQLGKASGIDVNAAVVGIIKI